MGQKEEETFSCAFLKLKIFTSDVEIAYLGRSKGFLNYLDEAFFFFFFLLSKTFKSRIYYNINSFYCARVLIIWLEDLDFRLVLGKSDKVG